MEFEHLELPTKVANEIRETTMETGALLSELSEEEIKKLNQLYLSEDYESYYIEYIGDIKESIDKLDYATIFFPGRFFAVVLVKSGMLNKLVKDVPQLINIIRFFPFTLSGLKISDSPYDPQVINKGNIPLNGSGIVVGIISTGIDYLNKNFITDGGESRIAAIWDQTVDTGPIPKNFIHGTEFTNVEINRALEEQRQGRDPYAIVNHKDEVGHGTAIAGIVGGSSKENTENLVSVAPNCEFAVVKLRKAKQRTLQSIGLENPREAVYGSYNMTSAVRYFAELQLRLNKPMVVYLAVGSNFGGHDGGTITERYIDLFSQRRNLVYVGDSGNQGNTATHASGQLIRTGDRKIIEINVDSEEKNLDVSLYVIGGDKIRVGITAPTGEELENIAVPNKIGEIASANLGGSDITIEYFPERQGIPDARLDIIIRNITPGVWRLNLLGEFITTGRFDAWLFQRELLAPGTRFLNPDPYCTLMTPNTAINNIVAASFNQQTGRILDESGRGFTRDGRIKPSVAINSANVLTTGLDSKLIVATGAAMAGGILAGTVALLLQWGIAEGNNVDMYPQRPRNYIIGGTIRQQNTVYPTPEVGYGQLDIEKLFTSLLESPQKNYKELEIERSWKEVVEKRGLYVRIPDEICEKLRVY